MDTSIAQSPDRISSSRGSVVVYPVEDGRSPDEHERVTHDQIARELASLHGFDFAAQYDASRHYATATYFVPSDTLVGLENARALGIACELDFFGGVVPHPFIATKSIGHPLIAANAHAPDGWSREFAERVRPLVLPGITAFTLDDARRAGMQLLERWPVRLKRAVGIGGSGQTVVRDAVSLDQTLDALDLYELSRYGVVLEQNLVDVTTYSIGQVRVATLQASYYGSQRATVNNHGQQVYGGSDLLVARGGFDAVLALQPPPESAHAIEQAIGYDAAAFECFPGLCASRRNYDVARGADIDGRTCTGVLEQSWRIGGATGAEIAALAAFRKNPRLIAVRASSVELYGDDKMPPAHAMVYFHGVDPRVGPLVKYSVAEPYAYA